MQLSVVLLFKTLILILIDVNTDICGKKQVSSKPHFDFNVQRNFARF